MVQEVFGFYEAKNGTKTDELLQAGTDGYPRVCQNVDSNCRRRQSTSKGGQKLIMLKVQWRQNMRSSGPSRGWS